MREIKLKNPVRYWLGKKRPSMTGKLHPLWKEDASYQALHDWVKRYLGRPQICTNCGTISAKRYEWANISGDHKREITDWVRLCVKCHRLMDGNSINNYANKTPFFFNRWSNSWEVRRNFRTSSL